MSGNRGDNELNTIAKIAQDLMDEESDQPPERPQTAFMNRFGELPCQQ